jgi:regulator of ribonuclease activity A
MNFETAALCDAHGSEVRVADDCLRHFGGSSRFRGEAVTLRVPADFGLVKATLEEPGNGRVLVVDGGGARGHALLGDRLALMASTGGWAGIVIHGSIRDCAAIAGIDIGVMALGTCPRRPALEGNGESGVVATFAGVTIHPGDWIYADPDGLLVSRTCLDG